MQKLNLCLHTGARTVTREQIAIVATPARTATWVPVPHDRLLAGIESQLTGAGLSVITEAHGLTCDGSRYFGMLQVANGNNPEDFGLVVAVRNSHDQSFPAGLVVGASVFVCDNLSFSGEIRLTRKHTVHVERDLPQLIERAIGRLGDLRQAQETRFAAYKAHEITDGQAHDLIIRALDAQIVPVTKLPEVVKEWREPRHPEFAQSGRAAWRLFQGFTETLKGNLDALPRRTQALHGLLDAACGLTGSRI
jgi:hypothetical protein